MEQKKPTPQGVEAFNAAASQLPTPGELPVQLDFRNYVVDFTKEPPRPDFLLEIGGVPVMPAGGITAVTGVKKQGKTQFLGAITSCLLSGRDFGCMKRLQAPGPILWVDTEQSSYDIYNTIGRVYRQAGIPMGADSAAHGLTVLQTRALAPLQRHEIINAAIDDVRPSLLIIDGVRDLINDFNSIEESQVLMTWIGTNLTINPGMRIAAVLHTNPGGTEKMRGHLGTELGNKLSDQFTCSKKNGVFSVEHESRGREMTTPFIFCIDGHGNLSPSTIEQRAGVVDADEALIAAVPDEGAPFNEIVRAYAKLTGMTQKAAHDALVARLNADVPSLVKDTSTKLFHRTRGQSK